MVKKQADVKESPATLVSMTGFGKSEVSDQAIRLEIELRSVNSRFLDLVFRMPRAYAQFESEMRSVIGSRLSRGRVEVTVVRTPLSNIATGVTFHRAIFDSILEVSDQVAEQHQCNDTNFRQGVIRDLLARKDVIELTESVANLEGEQELLVRGMTSAVEALLDMRVVEGRRMAADAEGRLVTLRKLWKDIKSEIEGASSTLSERLLDRIQRLSPEVQIDEGRLAVEVALLADRIDVTEELVRLESHFDLLKSTLSSSPNGRKLEFLLQECGREFNTIASKAQNAVVQGYVVDAKTCLEQLREQVLNAE